MLKFSEKLENINSTLKKEKSTKNTWREDITEKNKTLYFSASTRKTLEENGLDLENITYNYISYKAQPLSYNAIKSILAENSDIFRKSEKLEK
jgi:hypothetical protein